MPPFLLFPRPFFSPLLCHSFLNSSPKPYHPLQFSSLINMDRGRQGGSFANHHNTSSSSDSRAPHHHHPNQGNSLVWVERKHKAEPPHQSGVEHTSSGNSLEKPVLVPRVISQQMPRSSYRGRPFMAHSSSESATRGHNSEITHSRKGYRGPKSQMSSLKSNYVLVNRRDQDDSSMSVTRNNEPSPNKALNQRGGHQGTVEKKPTRDSLDASIGGTSPEQIQPLPTSFSDQLNATHTEKHFPAATISQSTMGQTSTAPEDGSSVHSHDSLHGSQAGGVVESPNRGQNVAVRQKSPDHSSKVIPQFRSTSPNIENADLHSTEAVIRPSEIEQNDIPRSTSPTIENACLRSTEAVIRPSEIEQNEIKEHVRLEHSYRETFQQRKSSPKRSNSHQGPGYTDDVACPLFDLFIQKPKTPVLKASLLEKNREKRKGRELLWNDPRPGMLRPGMVLLKNFITPDDQIKIVKKCRDAGLGAGGFYQPGYIDGAKLHLHMMCLGKDWDPQARSYQELRSVDGAKPPIIPDDFRKLVNDAIQASHAMIGVNGVTHPDEAIPLMEPDICIVNFYSNTGKLGLHQDKDESPESLREGLPVVSFSIGDSAEFLYGEDRNVDKAENIELKSGDVLIFGGKSRHIFHGVPSIIPKTAPKFLDEVNLRPGRLNLTFRKY